MAREIKFRIRDNDSKRMFYPNIKGDRGEFSYIPGWDGDISKGISYYQGEIERSNEVNGELMQFTGLKDKNGKEVYENDIVKSPSGIIDQIVWAEGCFCLLRAIERYELTYGINGYEVVGNTYENPELLADQISSSN